MLFKENKKVKQLIFGACHFQNASAVTRVKVDFDNRSPSYIKFMWKLLKAFPAFRDLVKVN